MFVTIFWTSHWFRSNSTIVSKNVRFFLLRFPKKALKFRNIEAKEKSDSKKCLKRNRQFTPSQACLLRKHFLNLIANTVNNRHQFFPQKHGRKKLNHVNLIWVRNFTLLLKCSKVLWYQEYSQKIFGDFVKSYFVPFGYLKFATYWDYPTYC